MRDAARQRLPVLVARAGHRQERAVSDEDEAQPRPHDARTSPAERARRCSSPRSHLPRRTFLRGMGATLALPLLDAMVPALTRAGQDRGGADRSASASSTCRTASIMKQWTPAQEGAGFELSPILQAARAVPRSADGGEQPGQTTARHGALRRAPAIVAERHVPAEADRGADPRRHDDRSDRSRSRSARTRRCRRSSWRPRITEPSSAPATPATAAPT